MLNLNRPGDGEDKDSAWSSEWKLLIFDAFCRDVISPLFNVAELRRQGVTLHLLLDADREAINDVPAVYFVQPTEANIRRIAADCADKLYERLYLNFVSPLPRPLLENLARSTLQSNSVAAIAKLHDQYLSFVCLEPSLVTLNQVDSYMAYNDPRLPDTQIEATMRSIATGLFSMFACMGVPPIIKCQPDGPGRMVASMLESMIRDHLSSGGVFGGGGSSAGTSSTAGGAGASTSSSLFSQRPVLILLDRSIDLAVALSHPATYQALAVDLLEGHHRRVTVPGGDDTSAASSSSVPAKAQSYDLDPGADSFWAAHRWSPFPDAITGHEAELKTVLDREVSIRRSAGVTSGDDAELEESLSARGLVDAVEALPALLKRKKTLEMHTLIMKTLLDVFSLRHTPTFNDVERNLHKREGVTELLSDPGRGSLKDKTRLACVYVLNAPSGLADVEEIKTAITTAASVITGPATPAASADELRDAMGAIDYAVSVRRMAGGGSDAAAAASAATIGSGISSKWLASIGKTTTSLLSKAAQGVKTLVSGEEALPVTRVVQAVCDNKAGGDADGWVTLDPKLSAYGPVSVGAEVGFSQAIVFVIGGGSYIEYANVMDYAKSRKTPLDVVYGSTEMCRPEGFLSQLARLGAGKAGR